jgi:hypothetical protein
MLELFIELFQFLVDSLIDWPWGTLLALYLFGFLLFLAWGIVYLIWYLLDSSFRPSLRCSGIVTRKRYTPGYWQTTWVSNGKTSYSIMYWVSETYELTVRINPGFGCISVNSSFYNSVTEGVNVYVTYSTGRFSGDVYLWNVWK